MAASSEAAVLGELRTARGAKSMGKYFASASVSPACAVLCCIRFATTQ
jgi:hypothetical protein